MKAFLFLGIIGSLAGFSTAHAANSASATAKISIISALNLTNNTDLDFGDFIQGETGVKSVTAGDPESANFSVSGAPNTAYNIVLPSSAVTMTNGTGGPNKEIDVAGFSSDKVGNSSTLDGSGSDSFNVGGETASLTGSEEVGDYAGSFTVTVAY